jgi:cytidine deaminase
MIQKEYIVNITEYNSADELHLDEQELIQSAKKAAKDAYAPYSNFKVGASVVLQNGEIISGNNQENAAYPSGLCAERVAVFYANSKYPNVAITKIAICAENENGMLKNPISPCGSCRQVLLETEIRFGLPIKLILFGTEKIITINTISQLLPLHFKKENLNE